MEREKVRELFDVVLMVYGTCTVLLISHKLCNTAGGYQSCPTRVTQAINERAKLDSAIAASECLLTIGIKKTKIYLNYYPYLWETVLVNYSPKKRAVLMFAVDALITCSFYFPSKLTRQVLMARSGLNRSHLPLVITMTKKILWESAMNIMLATVIGATLVAVTDERGGQKAKFAAVSCGARVLGGILVYTLSWLKPKGISQCHDDYGTLTPLASYTMQSALFSEVTNMAAQSDYPGQTNSVQFHQSWITLNRKSHLQCAICNHNPPHLTASGFQISGALAVIRLAAKGYIDYLSYGNDDVSYFFGFYKEVPHPVIPAFLIRYFVGNFINDLFDIIEQLAQSLVWKIEQKCCPPPYSTYHGRLSHISSSQ